MGPKTLFYLLRPLYYSASRLSELVAGHGATTRKIGSVSIRTSESFQAASIPSQMQFKKMPLDQALLFGASIGHMEHQPCRTLPKPFAFSAYKALLLSSHVGPLPDPFCTIAFLQELV